MGIPFAKPPVGKLRFAVPQPVTPWQGVRDCLRYGPTPLRDDSADTLIPEPAIPGEATLNLNVFTPQPGNTKAKLPVMVWIHGGGFTGGSPASPWYDGATFVRDGVVVVSISYRLGFIGFGLVKGAPSNRAVLDWLAALTWVQDNIEAFGGDPSRVTIAGQSAGGSAVLTLLGMECAQGLFSRAISISGVLSDTPESEGLDYSNQIGKILRVPPTMKALSEVAEMELLKAQNQALNPKNPAEYIKILHNGMLLAPRVDGELLVRPTLDSLRAGVGADKPLLIGSTDDEFSMVFTDKQNLWNWAPRHVMASIIGLRGNQYSEYLSDNQAIVSLGTARLLGRLVTDYLFRATVLKVLYSRKDASNWAYRFATVQPTTGLSIHCLDVPFWFDCLNKAGVEKLAGPNPSQSLATAMHNFATHFISQGDPGWPRWTPEKRSVEVLGDSLRGLGFTSEETSSTHITVNDAYRGARALLS